ncbi:MAG: VWA domain-containing protein, partial [Planctomycetota bacterium]
ISGSMARDEKLAISRRSVAAFVESLAEEDRFECMAFNLQPTPLFQGLRVASKENLHAASAFFNTQRARGGTVLGPALRSAYTYRDDDRPLNVVLLSDGMTETGEQAELLQLIQSRPEGSRVFCVGVGNEVNRPLLKQMAEQAGGLAAFVSTEDSFRRQAHLMRQKLIRPAIEDLTVQFDGGRVDMVEPSELGNLFYGTPLRLLGRYGKSGPVDVTLRGTIQGSPWSQTVQIALPKADEGYSPIERMWAYRRVSRLLGEERSGRGTQQDEIIRLCEGYSIVSPYASMLVLENDAEYKRWKIEQRNATRIERDRRSREQLQTKLATLKRANETRYVSTPTKEASTANKSVETPTVQDTAVPPSRLPMSDRGVDLDVPTPRSGGGGGGAIDPITATLAIGAAASAYFGRRRRKD